MPADNAQQQPSALITKKIIPKLTTFPIRGKAEAIRMMLEDNEISYENVFVGPEWMLEGMNTQAPFGRLPTLQAGDLQFTFVEPIMRYFGRTKNLYGISEAERANCDMLVTACEEWRLNYTQLVYHPNFVNLVAKYLREDLPRWLQYFEQFVANPPNKPPVLATAKGKPVNASKQVYLTGKNLSFVDYMVLEMLLVHEELSPNTLERYPRLKTFHDAMMSRPNLKRYLISDRRPSRINGAAAQWEPESSTPFLP